MNLENLRKRITNY